MTRQVKHVVRCEGRGLNPGEWMPIALITALLSVAFSGVIMALLHIVLIALALLGLVAIGAAALIIRREMRRRLQPVYRPSTIHRGAPAPPAVNAVHLHFGELDAAERAAVIRQLRGER